MGKTKITINNDGDVELDSNAKLTINAKGDATIKAQGNMELNASGDVKIEGNNVSVKGKVNASVEAGLQRR